MLKPRHLHQLAVLTESGSFNQAAEILHISQPSLTNSIKKLENDLGVILFERNSKGVKPTIYTKHILKKAPKILEDLNNLENEIFLLSNGEIGKINIGTGSVFIHKLLKDILPIFYNLYPNVKINIETNHAAKIFEGVKNGIYDIGICHSIFNQAEDNIEIYPLSKDPIRFITSIEHPLVLNKDAKIFDYFDYPFALPKLSFDNLIWLNENFSYRRKIKIQLTTNDYDFLIHMVKNTKMITAGPLHIFKKYIDNKELYCHNYENEKLYWNAVAIYKTISMHSKYLEFLLEMIENWFKVK
ncbi:LysR family transcriptional regulator [Acinetobacter nosocomialis]|uniref:LysR family transcriptional regulator n=1 Tax=Acinetobacter nosocomialis TaxID=106654 RepID=UPI0002CD7593|nr:LysR family transcriptional regulator [Acinetobacter nosocomialis]ENU47269.1 hypothetical protein F984_01638 [Acinetobacter nosocomialis NIPH 2119]QXC10666.1 LysR family transcriptional regulator [Acinetobacter nosocomialis]